MRAFLCLQNTNNMYDSVIKALFYESDHILYGNLFKSDFSDSKSNIDTIKTSSGFFIMGDDDEFSQMLISNRQTNIITSMQGSLIITEADKPKSIFPEVYASEVYTLAKYLSQLNELTEEIGNYADRLRVIVDKIQGSWSSCTLYAASNARSRVIIAANQCDIYFHIVHKPDKGFFALVWTDELSVFDDLSRDFLIYSVSPLSYNKVLVIHPMFLIDKWVRWTNRCNDKTTYLAALSILDRYLTRVGR